MACRLNTAHCLFFINKVILEQRNVRSLIHQPWLLSHSSGKAELLQETLYDLQSLILTGPLRKSLWVPILKALKRHNQIQCGLD